MTGAEVSISEVIIGVLGALGAVLGAWAAMRKAETDGRSKVAEAQSTAAMVLAQQQGAFHAHLIERVGTLEGRILEERARCDARLDDERARCETELKRMSCAIAKMQRGDSTQTRRDDPQ